MTDTGDTPDVTRPPRTVVLAFAATIANVVLFVASSVMMWGFTDYLRHELVRTNKNLKANDKNKKNPYDLTSPGGRAKVNHDLHGLLLSGLVQSLIFGLALILLAISFRKGRGWARWVVVALLVLPVVPTATPYRLLSLGGHAPALVRVVWAVLALVGLALIGLLIVPESSRYFAAVRGVTAGERPTGAATLGFRGLFGPRRPPADDAAEPARSSAPAGPWQRPAKVANPPATPPSDGVGPEPERARSAAEPARTEAASGRPAKAKVRAGTDTAPARPATTGVAAKSRGKSRKGS